jgi:LysW-gamma-L-lysine carboxypeptidase
MMIELLEQCVRIQSLSGQEQDVAQFLCEQMAARGFKSHIDAAGNAVGVIGGGSRQIVLLGHMDTVGGHVPVRYEDGKLYGRGAVDAKGPLCAFILAASQLRITNYELRDRQIIIIGAVEEESASSKGARYAAMQYHPEFCVIGEPSGTNGITVGYKGRLLVDAHFEKPAQHTSRPEPSASELAVNLWNWTTSFADRYNAGKAKAFDQVTPSLRGIRSGDDGLREWCDITIGLRLPPDFGPEQMQQEIENAELRIEKARANSQFSILNSQFNFRGHERAHRSSKDSPLARAFVDAIRAEKLRPAFKEKSGTADFNVVGPIWNCPMVAYGPGDSSLDHTPDEHIDVEEFETAVRVLTRVFQNLAGSV